MPIGGPRLAVIAEETGRVSERTVCYRKEHSMDSISRRHFLRTASIGAAATGVVAAGGVSLLTGTSGAVETPPKSTTPDAPILDGSDIVAHVVDARSGRISLFVGTKQIDYTNQALAQVLLNASR